MDEIENSTKGYVYILEVKDIDLPVCKIGMTSRDPNDRCAEINKSSTGDFIWEVAHKVLVDDCKRLESLVHEKLGPLKQKRREFFNINGDDAYRALRSILASQSNVKEITVEDMGASQTTIPRTGGYRPARKSSFRIIDSTYAELLQSFTTIIGIKGRPFGQLNKPVFGMSDGNEGVQWNIAVSTDTQEVRVGVNLEGLVYSGWPIATFILSELASPSINELKISLERPELIVVRFTRDAWQFHSRPKIVEQYLGGREIPMSEMDSEIWDLTLKEAICCLNEKKRYRGRNQQTVTLANQPKKGERRRTMWVCPHLNIWTPIDMNIDLTGSLETGIARLKPVHEWLSRVSQ